MLGEATATGPATDEDSQGLDRVSRRRRATKAEILDAAWALARSEGLTNFSMRDVATAVGMRAPSLYQYFDSKHAIYDAMFGQGAQQALESVCADLPSSVDRADRRAVLLEIAGRVFEFSTGDPARMQLLFQRTIPGFEPSPTSYAPAVEMSASVQGLLVELGFTDPDAMDLWTAMMAGLTNQQMSNEPGGTRWARLLGRTVDMFIDEMTSLSGRRSRGGGATAGQKRRTGGTTTTGSLTGSMNGTKTGAKSQTKTNNKSQTKTSTDKKRGR